jgi:hypothetical protein
LFCLTTKNVQEHHVFGGANRDKSTKYACIAYLCQNHHTGKNGVHMNADLDLKLKRMCQIRFEQIYGHEKFVKIFGRSYLS